MMDHRLIIHVTHERKFENNSNLYRFIEDEKTNAGQIDVSVTTYTIILG